MAILTDKFGRKHDYLRISLTERCNLRCFYCMPEEGIQIRDRKEFMTTEELIHIAKTYVDLGVKKIRLTGGEPTIRKDFPEIIKQLSLLPVELGITTNGVIIDQYLNLLKQSGVQSINVSLDSLQEDNFNRISRRNYFQKIMGNIRLLIDQDFKVKINVVLMRGVNDHEIIDFIKWSEREKIQIRFIEFMPFDGNKWNWEKTVSYKKILEEIYAYYGEESVFRMLDGKNDTTRNFQIKNAKGSFGIISSVTNPFCDTCNRIRLTADGKIKNCLFSQNETDLLSALRNGNDIVPLIIANCVQKEKARGGLSSFENTNEIRPKNRTMVTIGG